MLTEYAPLFEKRRLTADIADGVRIRGDETLLRRAVAVCWRMPPSIRRKTGACPFG